MEAISHDWVSQLLEPLLLSRDLEHDATQGSSVDARPFLGMNIGVVPLQCRFHDGNRFRVE